MWPFFFTWRHHHPAAFLKNNLEVLLCEKVKQRPVLYDKQMQGVEKMIYWALRGIRGQKAPRIYENGKSKLSVFFMLYQG